ncbi:DUF3443 domain-containing protein [Paraburkholderia jirisanensis]
MRFPNKMTDWIKWAGALLAIALIAACGGGGGSSDSGSSSSAAGPSQPLAANAVAVTVDSGLERFANIPVVTVTVCAPGTSNCQTIDHVLLDTKSFGLRLVNTSLGALASGLTPLPSGSGQLAQCTLFADGFTWGTIRGADVRIAGETASNIPIQVIGDLPAGSTPVTNCSDRGTSAENTAAELGANGILGIGVAPVDCGAACAAPIGNNNPSTYFSCPPGTTTNNCTRTSVPVAQQSANPVARFASDNNGLVVQFPAIADSGVKSVTGTMTFGINTQTNNAMPTTVTKLGSTGFGDLVKSTFNGVSSVDAFLDTGSNGLFFTASVAACGTQAPKFYCPTSQQAFSATLQGSDSTQAPVSFNASNAITLFNSGNFAFNNLAGENGSPLSLDLGLPFYFGRTVYHGLDQTASGGQSAFLAF